MALVEWPLAHWWVLIGVAALAVAAGGLWLRRKQQRM
ncbi:LPXTG cell wall anchor domain-containing protein [Streptomyces sp. NPDC057748]